jgi:hypothetical protein
MNEEENDEIRGNLKNPFAGYFDNLKKHKSAVNPVHEIVNCYYKMNGWEKMPKNFYTGRYAYNKLAKEAKMLYTACSEVLDDSIWALDKMKYLATKGGFDWSIITCLKHKLK